VIRASTAASKVKVRYKGIVYESRLGGSEGCAESLTDQNDLSGEGSTNPTKIQRLLRTQLQIRLECGGQVERERMREADGEATETNVLMRCVSVCACVCVRVCVVR